jgi:hypothetical protein
MKDALAEANDVPAVKAVRDRAIALEAYAREAKDSELMDHAVDVRLSAERRAGELLIEMAERGDRARGGEAGRRESPKITLDDLGLTKRQSSHWQKLAALDDEAFAERLAEARRAAWAAIELNAEERQAEKREKRDERERDTAEKILALPAKKYGVCLADPE